MVVATPVQDVHQTLLGKGLGWGSRHCGFRDDDHHSVPSLAQSLTTVTLGRCFDLSAPLFVICKTGISLLIA